MTRALIMSMWGMFGQACGEGNPVLFMHAFGYGSVVVGINSLVDMMRNPAQRDFPSIKEGLQSRRPMIFVEPVEDANRFATRTRCSGPEFSQFMKTFDGIIASRSGKQPSAFDEAAFLELMNPRLRSRLGLPDPAAIRASQDQRRREEERARLVQASSAACTKQYSDITFCGCLVEGMRRLDFTDQDWRLVAGDFGTLPRVVRDRTRLRDVVRACNK
jgi:hypothetical protein